MIAEVLDGTLYLQQCPTFAHTRARSRLLTLLSPLDLDDYSATGWSMLPKFELHLGSEPDIVVPDIAGWRNPNVTPEMEDAAWISVAPDWVCEVLSPSTEVRDRGVKLDIYLRERVGHVWLVDPLLETLEVYRHGGDHWIRCALHAGDVTVRAEPFETFDLEFRRLWKRRVAQP